MKVKFPKNFVWGVASSAYQIEGSINADGRGKTIWDTFCERPGTISNGDSGVHACDHYQRYVEDVALMADLGVSSYRFSIAWSRVQPTGPEDINIQGLQFYSNLIDELIQSGIEPTITLYHWDLPQWAQDIGGWESRIVAHHFANFVEIVTNALSDRVSRWITHNETFEHTVFGHVLGRHAPGQQKGLGLFPIVHHLLLSHGLAVRVLKKYAKRPPEIGIAQSFSPPRSASKGPDSKHIADTLNLLQERLHWEPLMLGMYPLELRELGLDLSVVLQGDMEIISEKIDFLGVNYYSPTYVQASPLGSELPIMEAEVPDEYSKTAMGWPIVPSALAEVLVGLSTKYKSLLPPIYITESGCAFPDDVRCNGAIFDRDRISYQRSHLEALHQAMQEGVVVKGYFIWTLLDNLEWAEGYRPKFGLVEVDRETMKRIPKDSYFWYQGHIREQSKY